ncbi:MBL fold metallo-hydrolase [Phaeodactylibacter luteus]|uniref:Metallo-beta-lactamase domain-containing protein n=1 Tax=Phaeodactylibacter luteus TaxID=1564516 RepID=A0A5C6S7A3_9BACT|nr:MBL fold metallo-hydrolase [Phaeodactylibacter luteus]TXB70279.1 hypothetical protein FRY97_00835 [Phaeodactylibacter luteus]
MVFPILTAALVSLAAIAAYLRYHPQFGGRLSRALKQRYARSPQWQGGQFANQLETSVDISPLTFPGFVRDNLRSAKGGRPARPIPLPPFDANAWAASDAPFQFVWFGHAACLMRIGGQNVLIDPMLGPDASPVGPIRTRRFSEGALELLPHLPEIDAVLLSHDHYDHLDYDSIMGLAGKVRRYYVALGLGRHLDRWGIPPSQVTELDWWDSARLGSLSVTFTPSRHFSGRGLRDRNACLWGGFALLSPAYRVYWTGDGGYGPHFKEVGEQLGPFDWAFTECGQYYRLWEQIHQLPEEAAQSVLDSGARIGTPVHWGAFKLAPHSWQEPAERFLSAAAAMPFSVALPEPGRIYQAGQPLPAARWWGPYSA